jgi:hypothetical protein
VVHDVRLKSADDYRHSDVTNFFVNIDGWQLVINMCDRMQAQLHEHAVMMFGIGADSAWRRA